MLVAERWRPLLKSLSVHALMIALFGSGWWMVRREPPQAQVLAIEATVVEARDVGLGRPAKPAPRPVPISPPQPEPEVTPPPEPAPEPAPVARPAPEPAPEPEPVKSTEPPPDKAREARQRELTQQRADAEKRRRVEEEQERAEQATREQAKKQDAERKAAERKEAERREAERQEAERKEAERQAAEQKRQAVDAKLRLERESELQRQLASEERAMAARAGGLGSQWAAAIQARIQRAWIRPASARTGLDCTVAVTQVPGGEVVAVRVLSCNGDETVRQSIEAAVYRASPLPPPPDPALFERNLEVRFKPND